MDDTQLSVAVWRPTPDRAVEVRMRWYRMRLTGSLGGAIRLLFLSLLLIALYRGIDALAGWFLIRVVWLLVQYVREQRTVGRWLPAGRELLAGSTERRVAARIVAHARTGAVVAVEHMYLRLPTVNWAQRQLIARTGEVR